MLIRKLHVSPDKKGQSLLNARRAIHQAVLLHQRFPDPAGL
jgi:hypothetical protein